MATNPDLFGNLIRELDGIPGIIQVMWLSAEGKFVDARLAGELLREELEATGSDMVDMLTKIVSDYAFGGPTTMEIAGRNGRIAVMNAGNEIGYLVIAGTLEMNVGLVAIVLQDAVERWQHGNACRR